MNQLSAQKSWKHLVLQLNNLWLQNIILRRKATPVVLLSIAIFPDVYR